MEAVPTVVQKYGGSSLATIEQVRQVARAVAQTYRSGRPTVVVVSARGHTTNDLLALAELVDPTGNAREADQLLATGEVESAALLAMTLIGFGVPAVSLTGAQAGVQVSGNHRSGLIERVQTERITGLLEQGNVVVVAGFQGTTGEGELLTLGRGGSDTTAVALAAELSAASCEIYTDVHGICTADPRVEPDAKVLSTVDAEVMAEMAFAGARVLHSRAVELAAMHGVDLLVSRSGTPHPGTIILNGSEEMLETSDVVVAVTHDLDVARVLVQSAETAGHDPVPDVLAELVHYSVPVDLITRSGPHEVEFRMGFTIKCSHLHDIVEPLQRLAASFAGTVQIDDQVGKVSLIGTGLLNRPENMARMLSVLTDAEIPTSWVSTSQVRISAVVPRARTVEAVQLLHREFGLGTDGTSARLNPSAGKER